MLSLISTSTSEKKTEIPITILAQDKSCTWFAGICARVNDQIKYEYMNILHGYKEVPWNSR